jgi:hypothetical protein
MTEGPRSPDVKRAIWLRNEYMVQTNGYRSLQALLDIDCDTKLVRIKTSIAFKENNLKFKLSSDDQPSPWQPAQAGSVLSGVVADTCRAAAPTAVAVATTAPTAPRAPPVEDAAAQARPGATPPAPAVSPATAPDVGAPAAAPSTPSGAAPAAAPLRLASAADQPPLHQRALSAPNTIGRRRAAALAPEAGSPERDRGAPGAGARIQLGAYGSRTLAEEASQRLRRRDPAAFAGRIAQIEPFASAKGQVWRLLLGPYADLRAAGAACKAVQEQGGECLVRR